MKFITDELPYVWVFFLCVCVSMAIGYKHSKKFCMRHFHIGMLKITDMVMMWNFEVISDNFQVVGIQADGNYAQKYVVKLHNCEF
jgi:hypothetical protein